MWLGLLALLSCAAPSEHEHEYPILKVSSGPTEVFVIGPPQQKAHWSIEPSIRVCAAAEVSIYRVSQATRFWNVLGYKFDGIFSDSSPSCMNPRYGEILITLPETGFSGSHMASTRTYTDIKTGDIVKAKIHILPKYAKRPRVLEHEFGHALGWAHYHQKFHIMHPTWQLGGLGTEGLRK